MPAPPSAEHDNRQALACCLPIRTQRDHLRSTTGRSSASIDHDGDSQGDELQIYESGVSPGVRRSAGLPGIPVEMTYSQLPRESRCGARQGEADYDAELHSRHFHVPFATMLFALLGVFARTQTCRAGTFERFGSSSRCSFSTTR